MLSKNFTWADAVVHQLCADLCFDFLCKMFTLAIGSSAGFQDADICPLGMVLDFGLLNSCQMRIISVSKSAFP